MILLGGKLNNHGIDYRISMDINTLRDVSDRAIDTAHEDLRRINLDVCVRIFIIQSFS